MVAGVFDPGRLTFTSGEGPCAVTGSITNADELRARVGLPAGAPIAEVVRALVTGEGSAAIGRMSGAFVVAHWDASTGRGLLATDHLGAGGLFYCARGSRLVFGSEVHAVLELLDREPAPDEEAVIRWLAYDSVGRGQTFYAGVRRLRGGCLIEFEGGSFTVYTYWAPEYRGVESGTLGEHSEAVRQAALDAVQRRLPDDGATGILLSGGLDSASIAAFAVGRRVLHAYSAVFPEHPEMDESRLINEVSTALGLRQATLAVRGGSLLPSALDYLTQWRVPTASPNLWFMGPLAATASADVAVLLDGEGGDELFGASPYVFADLLLHGRLGAAVRLADRLPGVHEPRRGEVLRWLTREWAIKGAAPYSLHAAARRIRPRHYASRWLTESAAAQHGRHVDRWEWKRLEGPRWWANLAFDLAEARQRSGAHDFLRHRSAAAGVDGRHPYFDDVELVEQMLRLPAEAAFDERFDRPLLRHANEGLLPDAIRLRPDKSYFNALFEQALCSTDRAPVLELLGDGAHIGRYVRLELLRGYVTGSIARPAGWAWIVWRAVVTECWLRTLEQRDFPALAAERWQLPPPKFDLRAPRSGVAL
jgi:asparagine synthase (glutamine-hydrolysing)